MSKQRFLSSSDRPYRFNPVTRRPLCRWCGKDVLPPKSTFCSSGCVHEYKLRASSSYLRQQLFKRDKGVCSKCGLDTVKFMAELRRRPDYAEKRVELKISGARLTYWDGDHIVPVAEGGGLCDLTNMTTLCLPCHKAKRRPRTETSR